MREMQGNWRDIFMAFRVGLDPKKLILCFFGLILSLFATAACTLTVGYWVDKHLAYSEHVGTLCHCVLKNLENIYNQPATTWAPFTVLMIVVHSIVWSIFGGAVTRIAALQVTKDESLELDKSMKYARHKYSSYFWSVGACVLGFLFFFIFVTLVAWPGAIPAHIGSFLSILLMVLYPLATLSGFLMTLIAIGTVFGSPLFYPAISAEGTDAFDAISRGFGYVYSKPWQYAFYQLLALGYGAVSVGFVYGFGWLMFTFTNAAGFSMGDTFAHIRGSLFGDSPESGLETLAGYIYMLWFMIIYGLVAAYGLSYFFSVQTIVYFLLRKKVDGIEVNEIYEEKDELPQTLPPQATGAAAPAGQQGAAPATPMQGTAPSAAVPPPSAPSGQQQGSAPTASPPPTGSGA